MDRTFTVKKARIEILSYVHINGAQFGVADYFYHQDKIYLVNWKRIFSSSVADKMKRVIDELYKDEQANFEGIKKILAENSETLKKEKVIIDEIKTDFTSETDKNRLLNIKFFIRYLNFKENSWQVYLPGSSVKGAFSTYHPDLKSASANFGFRDFYPKGEVKTVFKQFHRWTINCFGQSKAKKNVFYGEFVCPQQVFEGEFLMKKSITLKSPEEIRRNLININKEFCSSWPNDFEQVISERIKKNEYVFPIGFGFGKRGRTRFYDEHCQPLGLISLKIEE